MPAWHGVSGSFSNWGDPGFAGLSVGSAGWDCAVGGTMGDSLSSMVDVPSTITMLKHASDFVLRPL